MARRPKAETDIVREVEALCEVLNWRDEEVAIAEAAVAIFFAERDATWKELGKDVPQWDARHYTPEAFAGAIALLRRVGNAALDHPEVGGAAVVTPPRKPDDRYVAYLARPDGSESLAGQPGAATRFLPMEALNIDERDAARLTHLASIGPKWFEVRVIRPGSEYEPIVYVSWKGLAHDGTSRIVWATRALLAVLLGEVHLARCTVGWQKGPLKGTRCGRVYAVQGPAGRTRDYCGSEACKGRRKRAQPAYRAPKRTRK